MRWGFVVAIVLAGCDGAIGPPLHGDAAVDAPCGPQGACGSGVCLRVDGVRRCHERCLLSVDCGPGERCGVVGTDEDGLLAVCRDDPLETRRAPCADASDCASGLCFESRCTELCLTCPEGEACLPATFELAGGSTQLAVCQPRRVAADLVLGPIRTSSTGRSAPQALDVPQGTAGVVLILRDEQRARVAITRLESAGGSTLIDRADDALDANPMSPYLEVASALVPSSDLVVVTPGRWWFEVGTFDPAVFDDLVPVEGEVDAVDVLFEPEGEEGGSLDLHLGLAASFGLTATTATGAPFVNDLVGQVRASLLEPAGITLGDLRFSVSPAAHDRVEDGDETRAICRTLARAGPNGATVNVFVVDDLAYTSGHSGGTPGPPGVFDSAASCIVAERLASGRDTGLLVAHELGHFLGLRHTTELDGTPDPIGDTPLCPSETALRDCPDYRNLMFPRFPLDPDLSLTAEQIRVLRNNPVLYD